MILKWTRNVLMYVLILMFLLLLVSAVTSRINGGKPKILGKEILTVLSGSMEPGIKTGAVIAVNPVRGEEQQGAFKPGDVITYQALDGSGSLITHRVVSVSGEGPSLAYITKGDNNDAQDPAPIPAGNVIASYADFTVPLVGYFMNWVKSTAGIIIVMIIPGLYLVISSIITVFKSIMRMDDSAEPQIVPVESPPVTNG
ncbi:signal peptidase I [Paenibacillus sp. PK3_47]|uniref:signal peptidase I n=1 Tax=Paenibacillus sp. PK3_47 TaxID=2072642 RepID=UPI00201DECB4|nr:signal peptidase I [Paenibacillus sp. PK3_47]UQZ34485.1 signal peptidase I [Paenibacillus sp. PK3_47]